MDLNFAVKQDLRDDEVGERDWSQVNWKVDAVISFQNEACPFATCLDWFFLISVQILKKGILLHLGDLGHLDQAGVVEGQLQLGDLPLPCLCEYVADSFICIKQCNCFAKKKTMEANCDLWG